MHIAIDRDIEILGGKAYNLTITRITGFQVIHVRGQAVPVESVTYCDSAAGCSLSYTRARPPAAPAERAANLRRIRDVAASAMVDQGIW